MKLDLPTPYPDPYAWDSNLKAALESDPKRKANFELYQQSKRAVDVDYLPIRLDIENVSRCNFRCTMCQVSEWGPTFQRAQDMPLDHFKGLLDEQYGLIEIKLQGMGEPLLGRDQYFDMIKYARSKNIWVRSTTNSSLLHFRDNYKKLIDSGINEIQVSVDGATKETFENIRNGSRFEQVVDNCKLLNGYCNDNALLRTRMWTVVQSQNVHEFLDLVDLSHELGFLRLTFNLDLTLWGQDHWVQKNEPLNVENQITQELANKAIDRGKSLGLEVTFWNSVNKYETGSVDDICPWPFNRAYVSSDMRVVPCCLIATPEVADLGDARQFTKVWSSSAFKAFRKAHLDGRIPSYCQECYKKESS